jgi:hypothetical protein
MSGGRHLRFVAAWRLRGLRPIERPSTRKRGFNAQGIEGDGIRERRC